MKSKLLTLFVAAIIILLPAHFSVAANFYPMTAFGSMMENGQTSEFATWAGEEGPLWTEKGSGLVVVQRAGLFYISGEGEVQGLSGSLLAKKTLGIWNNVGLYAGIGGKLAYQIQKGDDNALAMWQLEFGADLYRKLGLAVGVDYIPVDQGGDRFFLYFQIDLSPKLF